MKSKANITDKSKVNIEQAKAVRKIIFILWAYVKKANGPSIKVLQGAGFKLDADLSANREAAIAYRIRL